MVKLFDKFKNIFSKNEDKPAEQVISVDDMDPFNPLAYAGQTGVAGWQRSIFDGSKFSGGLGATQLQQIDYWTLRHRSSEFFNDNLYAKGLIRRLITNIVNTGVFPESTPEEIILGVPEGSLADWSELVETRFSVWSKSPQACDWHRVSTFAEIERQALLESLVSGDVLIVMRVNTRTNTPSIELVSGNKVQTPLGGKAQIRNGNTVRHGVEQDSSGRIVAFWVTQKDRSSKRLPAFGEKTGRRVAWLMYGTEKRLDEVRGQPLLAVVLQSLKEIDRYRDSAQRKAVVNSILALFVKKTSDKPGSLPMQGGAVRKNSASVTDGDGTTRSFNIANYIPGVVIDELQEGEEPVPYSSAGTDINFPVFEAAIIESIAWCVQMPGEILKLAFSSNYSASQAASSEFIIYLNYAWARLAEQLCAPVYTEWLINETLTQKIKAPGLLVAWRDPKQYDIFGAWTASEWYGTIKPSIDGVKQAKAGQLRIKEGWSTNAREARGMSGTKFSRNIKRLKRENEQKADAMRPLLEIEKEFSNSETVQAMGGFGITANNEGVVDALDELTDKIDDMSEPRVN